MNIELPRKFTKSAKDKHVTVRKDGVLEIKGAWELYPLMSELTYKMKGKTVCQYCRRKIEPYRMTIDHLYPREFGGISITNNLGPACGNCNREKGSLNEAEYRVMRTFSTRAEKERYYKMCIAEKNRKKYNPHYLIGFDLPEEWIEYRNIKQITSGNNAKIYRKSKSYSKERAFIRKNNGKLSRPVVISKNGVLLESESVYYAAKDERITRIPVVVLENVIVIL